jgi:hypothetical protein
MNKLFIYISYLTILIAIIIILIVGFWSFYPYKPIVFNNIPFTVDQQVVKPGEILTYNVDYCKYMNINPIVTRYMTDGVYYMLSSNPAVNKAKGCGRVKIQIVVPQTIMPDTYYLKLDYIYKVNPIREISVQATTEGFVVVK